MPGRCSIVMICGGTLLSDGAPMALLQSFARPVEVRGYNFGGHIYGDPYWPTRAQPSAN
jgi:hypothetical protein